MNKIDLSKIHAAMRSIYRFSEFSSMKSPEILIDTEREILHKHFEELTAEEIIYILTHFDDYRKNQETQIVTENLQMNKDMARYLGNLN